GHDAVFPAARALLATLSQQWSHAGKPAADVALAEIPVREEMASGAEQVGDVVGVDGEVVGILVGLGVGGTDQDPLVLGFRNAEHHPAIIGMSQGNRALEW